ncbi:NAD(P)-dependent oxidoreductase [Sinorhizobium numidicum]|uniref:NAD(P)-dependent oxidoreductase n=1 Tax=Sinorhizobium numidicum TaxID=680248 RepID=A0ABY8CRH4_9HYPH|nr:NAD(P)-dependent oxidoreductase [Sinorhizobium numidicum]WEX75261.1 NAD(P)-dependent oxidoreductase [Sinorhizobium numidicum]WEX81256.1 NAD(P)-dependent oxidoreductase [Sinorhizobium numidicum]
MRHLITGGSGFIGHLLARRLRERGDSVRLLDVWSDPARPTDIEFIECSILNREGVAAAMRHVDIVHHCAALVAQTGAGRRHWDVNLDGTRIVAEEAEKSDVKAIFHLSTTAVYGIPPAGAIDASTPLRPVEAYGRSKLAGELLMKEICGRSGIPLTTIRPRVALGPGRLGIFQVLFEWIREGRNVYVIGTGDNRVQFVHAEDLIDFYVLALDTGRPGTYNVGTDRFQTLREDLERLIVHANSASKVRLLPEFLAINTLRLLYCARLSPLVPWHYLTYHRDCHFDVAPLLRMGWRPRYSNAEMLHETYDWYRANRITSVAPTSPHRSPLRQGALKLLKRLS